MDEPNDEQHERRSGNDRRAGEIAQQTTNALTSRELEQLHKEMQELRLEVMALKAERDKALRYGVGMLGAAVLAMGAWIWNLVAGKLHL